MLKRSGLFVVAVVAALVMTASAASAHFCYNGKRSATGNAAVDAKSKALLTYADQLAMFGMCPEGIAYVDAQTLVPLDVLTNSKATMAGGTFHSGNDAKGINHIDVPESEWLAFEEAIDDGFGECEPSA